ncbi:hypothetical protein ACWDR3_00315 [Streptomyces sp. NPDC001002]
MRRAVLVTVAAVALLLGLAAPPTLAGPPALAGQAEPPGTQLDPWFENPIGRMAYIARLARGIASPADVGRNLAMGFLDITGLDGLRTKGFEVVDVAELRRTNPALYRALGLRDQPGIGRFLVIKKTNDRSVFHDDDVTLERLHSEILMMISAAHYVGVDDPDRFFHVYTDNSPCSKCASAIPPGTEVSYAVRYRSKGYKALMKRLLTEAAEAKLGDKKVPQEKAQEKARMAELKEANIERKYETAKETNKVFRTGQGTGQGGTCALGLAPARSGVHRAALVAGPAAAVPAACGESAGVAGSGLVKALAEPVPQAPGGIDFSSLELRYLSDPGDGSGLQYSFRAPASATGGTSPALGVDAARLTSDAFFTWLELSPSAYWVNLNPGEPDRIVDERLGRTDAGRVMLQADLRLKKDVGQLIHPDTANGREFWSRLRGDCSADRVWIVPGPAEVRRDGDKLYILKAPLDVRTESAYRSAGQTASACAGQDEATRSHNESLFRSLVLPQLRKSVNSGPQYADLRRVYLARVAAEWYRELSRSRDTAYGDLVDGGDVGPWETTTGWRPRDTFDKYVESHTKGEFSVARDITVNGVVTRRLLTYGGVDLARVPLREVSEAAFARRYGAMSDDVGTSLKQPAGHDPSDALWLGSPTPRQAAGLGASGAGSSAWELALRLSPTLLLPLALLLWRRRRRLSVPAAASPLRRAAVRSAATPRRPEGDSHAVRRGREPPAT